MMHLLLATHLVKYHCIRRKENVCMKTLQMDKAVQIEKICTAIHNVFVFHVAVISAEMHPQPSLLTSTVFLHKHSASVTECQWGPFSPHGGIQ